jgi:hypothetical protein
MATPVSIESPPNGHLRTGSEQERDIQAKVQHMISLQCHEQQISNNDMVSNGYVEGESNITDEEQLQEDTYNDSSIGGLTMTKRQHTLTNNNLLALGGEADQSSSNDEDIRLLHPSSNDVNMNIPSSIHHPDVGKGTIVFSGSLQGSKYATGSGGSNIIDDTTLPNKEYFQQQQQQYDPQVPTTAAAGLLPQQIYAGYGSVVQEQQNHEYHYGNPDYNIDNDGYYEDDIDGNRRYQRRNESSNCFVRMCSCLYRPIVNLLGQENLHRSFCYGAIDGLLTGTGIASGFWGLGILSVRTRIEIRIAIVSFTVAACVADALCMAMGHIWTTYIVTSNHARERSHERYLLEQDKADSKGKLVDMLLARGILKIDAMSLADTLEGYPDLFISALVGDSLLSSGIQDALLDDQTDDGYNQQQQQQQSHRFYPCHSVGANMESPNANDYSASGDANDYSASGDANNARGFFGSLGSWKFSMHYDSERDNDSEGGHVRVVFRESQKEGIFMMIGFASFAIIPSLLWLFLPMWFDTTVPLLSQNEQHVSKLSSSSSSSSDIDDGESVSVPSLIILILSGIVWCLGVWKSYFVDSNWIVFGIETIAVLIVCITSAYGVAAFFVHSLSLDASFNEYTEWDHLSATMSPTNADLY